MRGTCIQPDPPCPIPARESKTEHQLRQELWREAYKLNMGTKAEQAEALDSIAFIVGVLQHSQHTPNPNKERT